MVWTVFGLLLGVAAVWAEELPPDVAALSQAMQIEDEVERLRALEAFVKQYPQSEQLTGVMYLLASLYHARGDIDSEVAIWRALVEREPKDPQPLNALAWLYASRGERLEEAEQLAVRALELVKGMGPGDKPSPEISDADFAEMLRRTRGNIEDTLGYVYYRQGKHEEALPHMEAAVEALPDSAEIVLHYAEVLRALGRSADALAAARLAGVAGEAYDSLRALHRELYVEVKGSAEGYEQELERLRAAAEEAKRKEIVASMVAEPSPDFKAEALKGGEIAKEQFAGKVAILNFWATWCGPCRKELPYFEKAYKKLGGRDDLVFLAVSTDAEETRGQVPGFIEKGGYTFPVAYGQAMAEAFGVTAIPTLIILGKDGKVVLRRTGFDPSIEMDRMLEWVLAALEERAGE
jgi:thiol-disulfide isomerase/thioredoxin